MVLGIIVAAVFIGATRIACLWMKHDSEKICTRLAKTKYEPGSEEYNRLAAAVTRLREQDTYDRDR